MLVFNYTEKVWITNVLSELFNSIGHLFLCLHLTMAHKTPNRKRTYVNGKPLSLELLSLVIDKIKENGGDEETAKVPYGTFAIVASDLNLHQNHSQQNLEKLPSKWYFRDSQAQGWTTTNSF